MGIRSLCCQTHLGQPPQNLVTLMGTVRDAASISSYSRILPDGTTSPFPNVPAGNFLVITDVTAQVVNSDVTRLSRVLINTNFSPPVFITDFPLDANNFVTVKNVSLTSGFVVGPGAVISCNVEVAPVPEDFNFDVILNGYLTE